MQTPRTSRRPRAGVAISCFSPRSNGRLVLTSMEAAGVAVAAMEVTVMKTTTT
jgi:hypothetical protein